YTEAMIVQVQKAAADSKLGTTTDSSMERGKTAQPSGTVARTTTATVAVEAIDKSVPSITVMTADGDKHAFRVQDAKNLEGVNKGDRIMLPYKEALAINVTAPPPAPAK